MSRSHGPGDTVPVQLDGRPRCQCVAVSRLDQLKMRPRPGGLALGVLGAVQLLGSVQPARCADVIFQRSEHTVEVQDGRGGVATRHFVVRHQSAAPSMVILLLHGSTKHKIDQNTQAPTELEPVRFLVAHARTHARTRTHTHTHKKESERPLVEGPSARGPALRRSERVSGLLLSKLVPYLSLDTEVCFIRLLRLGACVCDRYTL